MSERTNRGLKGGRENFVQFFGEKEVVCVNESSEGFRGVVSRLFSWHWAKVICDIFALIFPTCDEGRVEKGSGIGV